MHRVLDFIYDLESQEQEICMFLSEHIITFPNIQAKIRYRIPFYFAKSWICYLNPQKSGSVELCFLRANELSNIQGALDFKNRKQVAGITFKNVDEIKLDLITELLVEAIELDKEVPYNVRRKK